MRRPRGRGRNPHTGAPVVVASGSVALANVRLSLVAAGAFVDLGAVNLAQWGGLPYRLVLTDSAGKLLSGYLGAAGTGEVRLTAAQFTAATSESLSIVDNAALSTGDIDFAVAAWVYLDTNTAHRVVVSKQSADTAGEWQLTYLTAPTAKFRFLLPGSSESVLATAPTPAATGVWYFVVAWHDASANTINIQVNDGTVYTTTGVTGPSDTTATFRIGAGAATGDVASYFWDGRIGPAGIWKRVLTAAERATLYNAGLGVAYAGLPADFKTSLVAWWNLTEESGARSDSHGANHLTDNNTVTSNPGVVITAPAATGALIHAAPGGAQSWASEESGFSRNDASGYTYTVFRVGT